MMAQTATIEIDFDVHKTIETHRESFAETPNAVLRRLLGLSQAPAPVVPSGKPYSYQHVELPHGTEARMTYNNVIYTARIDNGFWVTEDGARHKSPSGAASSIAVTKDGGKTKLDGWTYWYVRKPGSPDYIHLNDLWRSTKVKF